MFTVALIGVDGAGKTTIAQQLVASYPLPMKYLYMGASIESSNFTLPTSRLILYLKKRAYRKWMKASGVAQPETISTHHLDSRELSRGKLAATARLLNRVAEEWFRQFVAWYYQLQGYIVLYDRHFVFEFATQNPTTQPQHLRLSDRLHLWSLQHIYPRPDLTIFLDALVEVLLSRKQEWSVDHLQSHRAAFLAQGEKMADFVRIDAAQPLEQVYAEVSEQIRQFAAAYAVSKPATLSALSPVARGNYLHAAERKGQESESTKYLP